MLKVLKFLEKKFPRLYSKLKNSEFINNLYAYFHLCLFILKKERKLFPLFLKSTMSYYIFRNKSDITFLFHWNEITMPRHLKWLDGFIEVWSDKFYDKIKWFNHVLDLWWYIGDSALKFAQNNKKVTVYEAHPWNFKYLKKNTKNLWNVIAYNKAVVWDEKLKTIKLYGWSFNMWAGNWHCSTRDNFIEVPTTSILDILKNDDFDALKMDIEGAEYDCFDAIISSKEDNFKFKEWFIEFHLSKEKESDLNKVKNVVKWLESKNYRIQYYDVIINEYFVSLKELKNNVFLVHFSNQW